MNGAVLLVGLAGLAGFALGCVLTAYAAGQVFDEIEAARRTPTPPADGRRSLSDYAEMALSPERRN